MRVQRLRTTGLATVGAAALVAATIAATPSAGAAGTHKIWVAEHTCSTKAVRGQSTCFAMKLVKRTVSTKKAQKLEARGVARTKRTQLGFGPAGGYTPKQLAKAYGVHPNHKTHMRVAIVDAFGDPSVRHDLNAWDRHYGLHKETKKSFKIVNQRGKTSPLPAGDPGWATETTLDVESVRALCHHCRILLVQADNNQNKNLGKAVNRAVKMGAKIVSNSYGGPEYRAKINKDWRHKGVAILASSGDSGWYDWTGFNAGYAATDKASTPAVLKGVIGVGGTTLTVNRNSSRASETVWNNNGQGDLPGAAIYVATGGYAPGAAGSGCSTIFKADSWQKKAKGFKSLGCGKKASEVDIAALADPFTGFDIYETFNWTGSSSNNGWATYGGTSLASPLTASMWALAGGPKKHVKHPEATLYNNYKHHRSSTYDVTFGGTGACMIYAPKTCKGLIDYITGTNKNPNRLGAGKIDCAWNGKGKLERHVGQCYAQKGYDGVSGVGSPKGLKIFK